tara:strand:+ start:219 stop:401 length:183 start_codon:yes stop_codon:yes gene_type:complete
MILGNCQGDDDSWKLSGDDDSWKKFPRGLSGRADMFSLSPARLNNLGTILASGIIKNINK